MDNKIIFDKELIRRYDTFGPRYTSYPTAVQFTTDCGVEDYLDWAKESNEDPIPAPLSLYLHIPFCDTICYYCGCSKVITKDKSKAAPLPFRRLSSTTRPWQAVRWTWPASWPCIAE